MSTRIAGATKKPEVPKPPPIPRLRATHTTTRPWLDALPMGRSVTVEINARSFLRLRRMAQNQATKRGRTPPVPPRVACILYVNGGTTERQSLWYRTPVTILTDDVVTQTLYGTLLPADLSWPRTAWPRPRFSACRVVRESSPLSSDVRETHARIVAPLRRPREERETAKAWWA